MFTPFRTVTYRGQNHRFCERFFLAIFLRKVLKANVVFTEKFVFHKIGHILEIFQNSIFLTFLTNRIMLPEQIIFRITFTDFLNLWEDEWGLRAERKSDANF